MGAVRLGVVAVLATLGCNNGEDAPAGSGTGGVNDPPTGPQDDDGPDPGTSEAEGEEAEAEAGEESDGGQPSDGNDPKFDVLNVPDTPPEECGGGGVGGGNGQADFSYIYISNTNQGTISKLNTQTMEEEARYYTRADAAGSPSRTSVNLMGDVAVANRSGGITKFHARLDNCTESNGMAGIQTSTGKDDILPWDEEECRAWHTPFTYFTQRPVAWTAGEYNQGNCTWQNMKLWTSGTESGGTIEVLLLDGEDGMVEFMVDTGITPGSFGAYGGAVDLEGDFWIIGQYTSGFPLVEIELVSGDVNVHMAPIDVHGYGITVDHAGRIWIGADVGNTARYDPGTDTWDLVPGLTGLGIQEHPDGYMWMGLFPDRGIQAIDVETLELGPYLALPSTSQTKGVSIDFYGYVWLVDMADTAYRIDPDTLDYQTYSELDFPYTYSDMTGWGLSIVAPPTG